MSQARPWYSLVNWWLVGAGLLIATIGNAFTGQVLGTLYVVGMILCLVGCRHLLHSWVDDRAASRDESP